MGEIDFSIMVALICILNYFKDTCDHVNNNFIMVADPHNMGLILSVICNTG